MAVRTLNHLEVARLIDYKHFVSAVQSAVMQKCNYLYSIRKGQWESLSDAEKKEHNYAYNVLRQGSVSNNVGFARCFCAQLIVQNVGVYDPQTLQFNDHAVTETMVETQIISESNIHFQAVFDFWISDTDISAESGT